MLLVFSTCYGRPGEERVGESMIALDDVLSKIACYNPDADVETIRRAYEYALNAHSGQYRSSGESYILHPLEVISTLADLELDDVTIIAGLLHDVVEDTDVTVLQLERLFGEEVAMLVDGVTKIEKLSFQSTRERQAENLRKMLVAMARDIRVIMIKLADRLHNMRTLRHLSVDRQQKMASETLDIFAPLAHRLGMWRIKWELEDLALRFLHPEDYYSLVEKVALKRREREGIIDEIRTTLTDNLAELGITAEIQGRPKHFYSIWQKMVKQGKDFSEIYDLTALRVIVDTVRDCYAALGLVHTLWKPMPGRFKDYIATPKSNMYQSLHTTVIGPGGHPVEIQIRTWDMHRTAEYGIAAHWKYKEGEAGRGLDDKIAWLGHLMELEKDLGDSDEFMDNLKVGLFEDEVFVFTPKGDVKNLPAEASPIDFAYAVHSHVGNHCIGAKVNGRMVPIDYELKNGDIVEILTSSTGAPSRDWLALVKTSKAKSRIRQYFKELRRDENITRGEEMVLREFKRLGLSDFGDPAVSDEFEDISERLGFTDPLDLLASIGYGKTSAQQVAGRIAVEREEKEKRNKPPSTAEEEAQEALSRLSTGRADRNKFGVRVKGVDDLLVRYSQCCNPVPGDDIIGFITRGRGVSVHRTDCPNVATLSEQPERTIEVQWNTSVDTAFKVDIEVEAIDRSGLLTDVMNLLTENKVNITSVVAHTTKQHRTVIRLGIEITSLEQLKTILSRISSMSGVLDAYRRSPA